DAVDVATGDFNITGLVQGQEYKLGFSDADMLSNWGTYGEQFYATGGISAATVSWPEFAATLTPGVSGTFIKWVPIQKSGLFIIKTYDVTTDEFLENVDVYMEFKTPAGTWEPVMGDGYAGYTMASGELDIPSEGARFDMAIMPGDYRFRFERDTYNTVWFEDAADSSTATTVTLLPYDPITYDGTWVEQRMTPSDLSSGTIVGSDRFAVAEGLMRDAFGDFTGVTNVIVASGLDVSAADPLSSAGLAGVYDAPIVLINQARTALPYQSAALLHDIAAANPTDKINVYIVGGAASVPDSFKSKVTAALGGAAHTGTITRFGGATRYDVAAGVAKHVRLKTGAQTCFIVNGSSPTYFW
ncbi:MAG: cell wall-binding repeat-containing protein, partial [Actinobacteria bacterium]